MATPQVNYAPLSKWIDTLPRFKISLPQLKFCKKESPRIRKLIREPCLQRFLTATALQMEDESKIPTMVDGISIECSNIDGTPGTWFNDLANTLPLEELQEMFYGRKGMFKYGCCFAEKGETKYFEHNVSVYFQIRTSKSTHPTTLTDIFVSTHFRPPIPYPKLTPEQRIRVNVVANVQQRVIHHLESWVIPLPVSHLRAPLIYRRFREGYLMGTSGELGDDTKVEEDIGMMRSSVSQKIIRVARETVEASVKPTKYSHTKITQKVTVGRRQKKKLHRIEGGIGFGPRR